MNLETKITIYKFTPQLFTLTQKSHRISNFLLHQIAYFCGQYINKKPLK